MGMFDNSAFGGMYINPQGMGINNPNLPSGGGGAGAVWGWGGGGLSDAAAQQQALAQRQNMFSELQTGMAGNQALNAQIQANMQTPVIDPNVLASKASQTAGAAYQKGARMLNQSEAARTGALSGGRLQSALNSLQRNTTSDQVNARMNAQIQGAQANRDAQTQAMQQAAQEQGRQDAFRQAMAEEYGNTSFYTPEQGVGGGGGFSSGGGESTKSSGKTTVATKATKAPRGTGPRPILGKKIGGTAKEKPQAPPRSRAGREAGAAVGAVTNRAAKAMPAAMGGAAVRAGAARAGQGIARAGGRLAIKGLTDRVLNSAQHGGGVLPGPQPRVRMW